PTQNAHVGVYAHENHVLDTLVFQQIPDLHARVADGVFILNLQKIDLSLPGRLRIASHAGQSLVPLLVLDRIVILPAVRLVDRILPLFLRGNEAAPLAICSRRRLWTVSKSPRLDSAPTRSNTIVSMAQHAAAQTIFLTRRNDWNC